MLGLPGRFGTTGGDRRPPLRRLGWGSAHKRCHDGGRATKDDNWLEAMNLPVYEDGDLYRRCHLP